MQTHSLHYAMLLLLAIVAQTAALPCEWLHNIHAESNLILPSRRSGYHLEVLFKASVSSARRFYNCSLQLYWPVPYSAYVDTDGLRQQHFDFDWLIKGDVDVEATADRVNAHTAELYLCSRKPFANSFTHTDTFTLPIHMRYQPAADENYAHVTVPAPRVLLRCSGDEIPKSCERIRAPCRCQQSKRCDYVLLPLNKTADLTVTLPTGRRGHFVVVLIVTCVIIALSSLCLCMKTCDVEEKEHVVNEAMDGQVGADYSAFRRPSMPDEDLSTNESAEDSTYEDDGD